MFAGQAIAVKVSGDPTSSNNGIFYFHNDHLGSTSVLTKDSDGYVLGSSVVRYYPFGGYRDAGAQELTDRGYTGHKENLDIGLIYMNARFYVPGIARFASADTIVPDPANPQSYNRYSYVENRPIIMFDPSGHNGCTFGYLDCDADDGIDANGFPPTNSDEVNQALGAAGAASGTVALAVTCELCDWYMTVNAWSQGDFSYWDLAGFLPIIPGAASRAIDDVRDTVKYADEVGTATASVSRRLSQGRIYRSASGTPDSLTPRPGIDDVPNGGLSFFDNLENAGIRPGNKYVSIDVSQLHTLEAVFDNVPPGHVSVRPQSLSELQGWAATRGTGQVHPFTQELLDADLFIGKMPK